MNTVSPAEEPRPQNRPKSRTKAILLTFAAFCSLCAILGCGALWWSHYVVQRSSAGIVFADASSIPKRKVALVLGCSPTVGSGRPNLFFTYRMDAAFELWRSGKADFLLVSGDNHIVGYDEPSEMRNALIERGVPSEVIVRDFAGLRTLDSVLRAERVFGETSICIVSQEDHVKRAIYIAKQSGIDAIGYPAKAVPLRRGFQTSFRESLARVQAVVDVTMLQRQPRHLGPKLPIGPALAETGS